MPTYNHLYAPPKSQQPISTIPQQQPQQQPEAQVPPPAPLNQNGGSY